jgi:hypothetical protein
VLHLLLGLLWEEHAVDVWQNTTAGDGHTSEELGELLVVADRELDVAWGDASLLVVAGGVTGELESLGGEVLEDGREVDRGTGTNTLGEVALLQEAADTANWELEAGLGRFAFAAGGLLATALATLTFSGHDI